MLPPILSIAAAELLMLPIQLLELRPPPLFVVPARLPPPLTTLSIRRLLQLLSAVRRVQQLPLIA